MIALLATGSEEQLDLARDMAALVAPRPGFTLQPLTTNAAAHMTDLVEGAARIRRPSRADSVVRIRRVRPIVHPCR